MTRLVRCLRFDPGSADGARCAAVAPCRQTIGGAADNATPRFAVRWLLLLFAALVPARAARAQDSAATDPPAVAPVTDSVAASARAAEDGRRAPRRRRWTRFGLGVGSSLAVHELGHVVAAYAVGARPSIGLNRGRPTVYSGLSEAAEPRKQFVFSSAGLAAQMVLDELLLDVPHERGGDFESGVLAGGLATVAFYVTIGRNARVSDVTRMAATSSLNRTEISLIFGAVSALHAVRIHRGGYFLRPYATPANDGRLRVGVWGAHH